MDFRTAEALLLYIYSLSDHKVSASAFNNCSGMTSGFVSRLVSQHLLSPCDFKPIADVAGSAKLPTAYVVTTSGASLCESLLEKSKRDADEEEDRKFQRDFQKKQARKDTFRFWLRLFVDIVIAVGGVAAGAFLQYRLLIVEWLLNIH